MANATTLCDVESCNQPRTLRRWCRNHYNRWLRHGDPEAGYRSPGAPLPPCAVDGCTRATRRLVRGWCEMHYARWAATGDVGPIKGRIWGDDLARFTASYVVDAESGCWLWQRSTTSSGYASFAYAGGTSAHGWSYEQHIGPVPEGLEIDHLCAVRSCVNPLHLEAVTHEENMSRVAARGPLREWRKTLARMEAFLRFAGDLGRDPYDPEVQALAAMHAGVGDGLAADRQEVEKIVRAAQIMRSTATA